MAGDIGNPPTPNVRKPIIKHLHIYDVRFLRLPQTVGHTNPFLWTVYVSSSTSCVRAGRVHFLFHNRKKRWWHSKSSWSDQFSSKTWWTETGKLRDELQSGGWDQRDVWRDTWGTERTSDQTIAPSKEQLWELQEVWSASVFSSFVMVKKMSRCVGIHPRVCSFWPSQKEKTLSTYVTEWSSFSWWSRSNIWNTNLRWKGFWKVDWTGNLKLGILQWW